MSCRGTNVGHYILMQGHVNRATSQNHDHLSDSTVCSMCTIIAWCHALTQLYCGENRVIYPVQSHNVTQLSTFETGNVEKLICFFNHNRCIEKLFSEREVQHV